MERGKAAARQAASRKILWSLPSARVMTLIITLLGLAHAAVAVQQQQLQAISIDSDQAPNATSLVAKSESNPSASQAQSYLTAPAATQPPHSATIKTATSSPTGQQQQQQPQLQQHTSQSSRKSQTPTTSHQQVTSKQNSPRVRRPTQTHTVASHPVGLHHGHQETATTSATSAATTETSADQQLQEEIKRMMAEYSNTPPLFVTTTRDFFVDVARYPLGFKLATMQALDSEGDRVEYSLKPASYRDASPYFTINATSGELRLANKRIPLQVESIESTSSISGGGDELEDNDDDNDGEAGAMLANGGENNGQRQLGKSLAVRSQADPEKPGFLYFLNVAANDGKYTSIVELQIHVFNSTSFGTKSPVQLTMEGGRRGGENAMRAKTSEFFEKLYKPSSGSLIPADFVNNSTLVFPSFVNPGLSSHQHATAAGSPTPLTAVQDEDFVATTPSSLLQIQGNDIVGHQANSALSGGLSTANVPNPSAPFVVGSFDGDGLAVDRNRQQADAMVMQQPMMLSFVIVIVCSFITIALVLLIFVVPLSVKRLKKRLKTMELQHEQLSRSASNGGSSIGVGSSSAISMMGSSSMATSGGHLPSLSQFTLSGSDRSCAMSQMPNNQHHHNHHHQPLDRQSSLDSAITSGQFATASNSTSYQASQRYHLPQHQQQDHQQQMNQHNHFQIITNGLNRINNGAIVNPIYQQQHQHQRQHTDQPFAQQQFQQHTGDEPNNIYCPIDGDDFYSTINTNETIDSGAGANHGGPMITPSGMIVGRTCDSRQYFGSQCAPTAQLRQQRAVAINGCDNQPLQQRDTDTPQSRSSSRSSTRSLARFLSLPARHWSHQQYQHSIDSDDTAKRKQSSFLDDLELHFSETPAGALKSSQAVQTIARANHISHEQQVRSPNKRSRRLLQSGGGNADGEHELEHEWELDRHRLMWGNLIDEGQFGMVFWCKLKQDQQDSTATTVAVKMLKKKLASDRESRGELLAEIEIMKRVCGHPNVVKILHCCTRDLSDQRPILLVMEHVELGKLQSFLQKSRTSHNYATRAIDYLVADDDAESSLYDATSGSNSAGRPPPLPPARPTASRQQAVDQLTSRELIKFIYHVAKGMEYVSSQSIVHRDLASRNILLSSQRVCKIGDFGMARQVGSACDVYERRSPNAQVPVRWMAPEVLLKNSFTSKSDVYSFGILMWEIVTLGSTPYAELKTDEIREQVARRNIRPSKPDYCHSLLYNIMSKCWSVQPCERPTFAELVRQLDELLMSTNEYIELDQYPDHNYYNIQPAPGELV